MTLLDNETVAVPKFISAQKLLEDKFILEFSNNNDNKNNTNKIKNLDTKEFVFIYYRFKIIFYNNNKINELMN